MAGSGFVLNLVGRERVYMDVTVSLPSGKKRLKVLEPTKALSDDLDSLLSLGDDKPPAVSEIYRVAAMVLSNNDRGEDVPLDEVERGVPLSHCVKLLRSYWEFEVQQLDSLLKN